MKTNQLVLFLSFIIFISNFTLGQEKKFSDLETGFLNPPISAKPKGYWCLVNGNFDLTQMTIELKEFKEKGMGTLDIWDVAGWVDPNGVIPDGPSFMGDESVQAIAHGIREAGKIGMEIGLTISSSWNAGGSWVKPEDGVMGLFDTSLVINGPSYFSENIPFPHIPNRYNGLQDGIKMLLEKGDDGLPTFYKDVVLLAYQARDDSLISNLVDISGHFKNGKLNWNVPTGKWKITRYITTGTGQPLMRPSPNSNGLMIDHFNPEAMKRHLNFFFEKLENELGDLSKTALQYLYTDSYEANSAVWTVKLPEEFKRRNRYELTSYLPALEGYIIKSKEVTERFLFDFKKTLSDLIIENHYELGKKMCNEKGLDFIAEAGGPGPPIHNCPFESLSSLGKCSVPRGEFWYDSLFTKEKKDELQIIKGPASASHLYNQPRVEAEAFTGTQLWQFGPGDLKATADKAMCEGLTSFVYHTTPHIPREAGKPGWVYNFGTIINTTRAWWDLSEGFHNYLARSCFLLQQGNFVGDVLFYYGDKAPNFVDRKKFIQSLGFGYDYDYTNSDIILNRLDVKDGRFVLPHGQSYKILVLPDDDAMNPKVLEKISALVKKGGIVVGKKPTHSHSLSNYKVNDKRIKELAEKMWSDENHKISFGKGIVYSKTQPLREVLKDLSVRPDIQINKENPQNHLDYIHRSTDEADIYFVRNTSDQKQTFEFKLRSKKGVPEIWNSDYATINKLPIYITENGITTFPLNLDGFGSTFIILRNNEMKKHIVEISINDEVLFPNSKDRFPISFSKDKIIFESEGKYKIIYSDGSEKIFDNSKTVEEKEITGNWKLKFPYGKGAPQNITLDKLKSWTDFEDEGIKHFSGIATYLKQIELTEDEVDINNQITLDLGGVSKVAKVFFNGKPLDILWYSPYQIDITKTAKKGKNNLIIEVANVLSNQMTGDAHRVGKDKRTHSNITKGPNAWISPWKEVPLVKSGLLGPVKIKFNKILK
ncbi:MAG: glycosyl hydrolase [Melioribacteraceae bacterium]